MDICWFLKIKTTSIEDSISSKSTENILQDKDEENVNARRNWNEKGLEQNVLRNETLYLLEKKSSDDEKFECVYHRMLDNSFNYPAKQYKDL